MPKCSHSHNSGRLKKRYKIKQKLALFLFVITAMQPLNSTAVTYSLADNGARLIGYNERYKVRAGDYFHAIARFYNIGLLALMESNPSVDPFLPALGSKLKIPIRMILPDVPYTGIVINLPEFRLYYFSKKNPTVHVFPVGIGRINRPTPLMKSRIKRKIKSPAWTPNSKIRADHFAKYGKELPSIVAPGKDNPLGEYALQLAFGQGNYLIHGTNQNFGIGMRVSAGCIRMNPDDIEWLFKQVPVDETVTIINQPIKIAVEPDGAKMLEVHSPLSAKSNEKSKDLNKIYESIKFHRLGKVNIIKVNKTLVLHQGIPINISI